MADYIMLKLIKNTSLPTFLFISILISANEESVEVNMENILEVGRENQTLSANSQDKIDKTERQTDKIVNEFKVPWVKLSLNKIGAIRGARDVGVIIERGSK